METGKEDNEMTVPIVETTDFNTPSVSLPHPLGGTQKIWRFKNGYGASVVIFPYSYGYEAGLWELGVLEFNADGTYGLTYETCVSNDVIGHLSESEVEVFLKKIQELKQK